MPAVNIDGVLVPSNPYDARQMVNHLELNPAEAKSVIWTFINAVSPEASDANTVAMRRSLKSFLHRIYYDLRNLGQLDRDRALNFAATNAFQAASTFELAIASGMELDSIEVEKSPLCRLNSNCWDVKLKFFDPENSRP